MLIGIPALLGPELLYALRAMGHGDELAIVDANYPAQEHARRLVRADGHGLVDMIRAVLTVFPIDQSQPAALFRTALNNCPPQKSSIHDKIDALLHAMRPGYQVTVLDGGAFYPRVRAAHTVIATGELALFANVILRKGVVTIDDAVA